MSSALGMNLMPPTSAFQHAGAGSASSGVLQKQSDDQDSNSATEVTKDNIEEEVQEKQANVISTTEVTSVDPYDMDSDLDQQDSHQAMDSMEEDQSSFQGLTEDLESRLSPSKDTVSEDDDTKDTSLALNHSPVSSQTIRNKRKNFKPRNIIYEQEQELLQEQQLKQQQQLQQLMQQRIEPKKIESPMDLSINNGHQSENSDEEEESREHPHPHPRLQMPPGPIPGLSVVRPEVLFGQANKMPPGMAGGPIPPFLAPFLAASRAEGANGPSIKDAFQEVLKIFGFPPELAEVFAKNAQALQQNQDQNQPENQPIAASSMEDSRHENDLLSRSPGPNPNPSGMLSAALLGAAPNSAPSTHPPTPPRTPKAPTAAALAAAAAAASTADTKPPMAHNQAGQSAGPPPPPMPPLLSLAAIQEQVKAPNILAAQLTKPTMMMPGMGNNPNWPPSLGPGPPSSNPLSQIPPHILAQRAGVLGGSSKSPTDYTRYFRRFSSSLECGSYYCKDMNYREHFHCTVPMCKSKVFAKKEEMIRHSKWHQKMDEAYKYGFRRVTPTDDCSDQFPGCQHNKKQTHYHCIQSGHCDKVYISTSDVQMHFNYHRKDNAIQREGFLRFRGCEDCATHYCPFRGQKTTHFHCNRTGCQFTFKNKADMEKHKNFHMKDEQLNKDGFKKFMKQDPCGYDNCRFSKTVNHIHCVRPNCDYVLHSSGQLFNHKRKHERKDNELAYRKYKITQSMLASLGPNATEEQKEQVAKIAEAAAQTMNGDPHHDRPASNGSMHAPSDGSNTPPLQLPASMQPQPHFQPPPPPPVAALSMLPHLRPQMPNLPQFGLGQFGGPQAPQPLPPSGLFGMGGGPQPPMLLSEMVRDRVPDDAWHNYMLNFDSGEGCGFQGCDVEDLTHWHCKDDGCEMVFRHEDGVRDHGRNHFIQDQISDLFFVRGDPEDEPDAPECTESCQHRKIGLHYHCKWENCTEVIFNTDPPFKRLDHYKLHEYTRKWNFSSANKEPVTMTLTTSIDAMFKRKRGRPPKNRVIEVWNDNFGHMGGMPGSPDLHGSPQAVFTSFKLPKPGGESPMPSEIPMSSPLPTTPQSPGGFGSRLFPMGLGNPPLGPTGLLSSPPKVSAPLGGLPALADQLLMSSPPPKPKEESNNNHKEEDNDSPPGSPLPKKESSGSEQGTPPKHQGLIKAKGTYYPLTAFPTNMPQGPVMRNRGESPPRVEQPVSGDEVSPTISLKSKLGVNFMVSFSKTNNEAENPLAKLLQASQEMVSSGSTNTSTSPSNAASELPQILSLNSHPQFGPEPEEESCGRPFCKLKRRPHFHCNICNQGFTEKDKLEPHLKRHASPQEIANSLAALLNPTSPTDSNHPENLAQTSVTSVSQQPLMATTTTSNSSPASSPKSASPPPPSTSMASSPIPLSMPGLPPGFPAPPFGLNGLLRHPLSLPSPTSSPQPVNAQNLLLSQNPFLPPGIMLPGMPHPFPRFPGLTPDGRLQLPTSPTSNAAAAALQNLSRLPDTNSLKRSSPMSDILSDDSLNPEQKKMRLQSSMRMLKDEPVPEGYMRFRFNEDCQFQSCNYREHQTHFHCMRKDCNYRFCDKTRFVQHTARHERLDTLCGEEFEGFRGVPCGRPQCELNAMHARLPAAGDAQKSSSHFHCLKCDYYCTDTNKVVAHRRQHQKLDSIMAAGFEKYTPTQYCPVGGCPHNGKQTHYHCSKCQYAVLGLSQMEGHKYRHMNE